MPEVENKVVLLAGASGLVGACALDTLLGAPEIGRVFAVTRRSLGREHPRLANRIVQFDQLEAQLKGLTCQVAFCCLGASPGATVDEARRVEWDYVLAFARAAKAAQAQRFVLLSCAGADPGSKDVRRVIKAEVEQELARLGFVSLDVLQPGRLLGWRREMRPAQIAAFAGMPLVNPFLIGQREIHRGISAVTVGAAMLGAVRLGRRGVQRYTWSGIRSLARQKPLRLLPVTDPKARTGA
jgi:uncharacterized protein YbjT (DUF2867 family)